VTVGNKGAGVGVITITTGPVLPGTVAVGVTKATTMTGVARFTAVFSSGANTGESVTVKIR
jgi:hypothetical protein